MSTAVWDLATKTKQSYVNLFKAVNNPENYTKEELLAIMEREAKSLKSEYKGLADEYGWGR